ncbi:LamB/YcsF family protein [Paenibacillus athensensis]|uniref:5-oxoprolinase subunit A n=1 Tax=Paenibacillus athensensis TaxID=1967502 RepID=A0A4Y8PXY2_9BACL|nr:5-oxoprolinase subunit PxpA [Paenibacillus athensensis]MCD1259333.1 LamB/YcsF family protein [Paenibacillus athensensis]
MLSIDLNCDMGESFGQYRLGRDEELLDYVSSANIACGFHAGDPATMRRTVQLCLRKGVQIGAHPGLPDLQGFGRRELAITPAEAYELTLYQLGALQAFVRAEGGSLQHVKPHGALYHMAAKRHDLAAAVAAAVVSVGAELTLYGPPGSELLRAGAAAGLRTAGEAFADRTYRADGSLTPRDQPRSLIASAAEAAAQVERLVRQGAVLSVDGEEVPLAAETVCVHGDGAHAVEFARDIRAALAQCGIAVRPLG